MSSCLILLSIIRHFSTQILHICQTPKLYNHSNISHKSHYSCSIHPKSSHSKLLLSLSIIPTYHAISAPTPPLPLQRTLPLSTFAKHADKHPRQPLLLQPHTTHVQPLEASLALHHQRIGIIHQAIAHAPRAIITLATAFRRRGRGSRRRAVEGIRVRVVSAVRL